MQSLRDLWKIATAYLVGSFALIQFVNIALPYFEVESILGLSSDILMRFLFIGLPIGLPLVLVIGFALNKKGLINQISSTDNKDNTGSSVTLVHKGNIMKYTEGAFRDWGYELANKEYGGVEIDEGPWQEITNPNNGKKIVIKDVICDAFLQQILLRPTEYDVIATMNLNGDYISDALAAMVGGIGIAPGANISDQYAVFEATHGTAPKYAGQNKVNPGSLILSAEMMLRHMGWLDAADLIMSSMDRAIGAKKVTYDFARMMNDADLVSSSGFADEMIKRM